ncbi:hypothetical protein AB2L27_11930 [Kineococcus sp. LSe6-4]|uniref:Uncharacterized protein n=1 Tax=Kineococcus halophytocola TaxID=3234027 RepID=A0ABV4H1M5_9ACTN
MCPILWPLVRCRPTRCPDAADDLGLPLPAAVRHGQWTKPLTPASYAYLVPALLARVGAPAARETVTSW